MTNPIRKSSIKLSVISLIAVLSTGCYWQVSNTRQPTIGSQLMDLQKARDAGSLTAAEYEAQRSRVLDGK